MNGPMIGPRAVANADPRLIAGRFQVVGLLGSGGSASVFEARDFATQRTIALKILHPHLSTSAAMRTGFLLEVSAAENLRHPNIALVLGYGIQGTDDSSIAWIALERAAGISLAEHVRLNGPLNWHDALTVTDGLLAALEAAHAQGMVHRDVSPANVMVDHPGERRGLRATDICLVDFGLADVIGRTTAGSDIVRSETAENTAKGVLGSVNYMSPEQALGQPVGERGDIYQAGATLYFALTGLAPYLRSTPGAVMRAHLEAPPPVPSVVAAGIPSAVDRIVVTAMNTVETDRYSSAAKMRRVVRDSSPRGAVSNHTLLLTGQLIDLAWKDATTASHRVMKRDVGYPRRELSALTPSTVHRRGLAMVGSIGAIGSVLAIAWLLAANGAPGSLLAEAHPTTAAPSPQPSTSEVSTVRPPAASTIAVPRLEALSLDDARAALNSAGLALGTVSSINSPVAARTVLSVTGGEGGSAARGARIDLVVASGSNAVPRVVGLAASAALDTVRAAGFTAVRQDRMDSDHVSGTVLGSDPAETVVLPLGSDVVIDVSVPRPTRPTVTPTPGPAPGPTPGPTPSVTPTTKPITP